jgi:DNA-binding winged helix-turn-helix (wHTH) protein/tetratricopeptide (TPR) repeat protein
MAVETQSPVALRFGAFELDLRAGELHKQGLRVKLQEQPFRVLAILIHRPGEVVTRDELRAQLWPADTFVDFDNSLNTSINKLREALGDSADDPRFIETLPRRGYRFSASVSRVDSRVGANFPAVTAAVPTRAWRIVVAVAVIVLAVAVAVRVRWHSWQGHRLTEKDTIVLADFTNTTGDLVFDETLKQGLRVQLEQSPFLNILSEQKASEQLGLMGRPEEERLRQDVARELCQRVGGKAVLAGSIASLGTHYVIWLNAFNCHTGDGLGGEQVEADAREHVLRALGEAATKMRKKLGESLVTIQKYDAPVEQATTSSLAALQAYSLGLKIWFAKGVDDSIPFFQRAVELDPEFAMAYGRLGTAYSEVGEGVLSVENTRKGYELREKVSQRERLYLESHYYHFVTGDLEKAAQLYELWRQIYPRDWVPYTNLVAVYGELGKYEKALEEAREELRLDQSNEEIYGDLAGSYFNLNRLAEAEAVLKQAEEHKIEMLGSSYQLALLRGDARERERLAARAAGKPVAEYLLFLDTFMEAYHGRRRRVRELLGRKLELAERAGATQRAASHQADTSLMEAYFGDPQEARRDAEAALKLSEKRDSWVTSALALALALTGNTKQAEKLAAELNQKFPLNTRVQRCTLPAIRAAVALHRGNADKALAFLPNVTSPYELGAVELLDPIYLRGQVYLMLHNGPAAAAEFQKIVDLPDIARENLLGALAHRGLAQAYALQGDTALARAANHDFLTLWKDADPDIPILKEAKVEYAKLK